MLADILRVPCEHVLDIGAGDGRWGKLLKGKVGRLTGVEIWEPYVERYGLAAVYDQVLNIDVRSMQNFNEHWDVIILGDVLEHMARKDAIALIAKLKHSSGRVYLTIPISRCDQNGEVYGNPYETHLDQWTDEELKRLGWVQLHAGPNPNGKVMIGTYRLATQRSAEPDMLASYTSASGGAPVKLLQSKDAVIDGRIVPVHLQVCPTNRCNLNCDFCSCSGRDKKLELSWSAIQELLVMFRDCGTRAITITGGGEPLLHPKINQMIDLCRGLGIDVGLVTNGIAIDRLATHDLMWIRVSTSDKRDLDGHFWERLDRAVGARPETDWNFSHVLTAEPDYDVIRQVLEFAGTHDFTHVRIVSDLLNLDQVPSMEEVRRELTSAPGEDLALYQGRKAFTRGRKRCLISLLKPTIAADGHAYPCCGVQYALPDPTYDFEGRMDMGEYRDFPTRLASQEPFDGSPCVQCYYDEYNVMLDLMTRSLKHRRHV
jgi:organic radical activating enzyme